MNLAFRGSLLATALLGLVGCESAEAKRKAKAEAERAAIWAALTYDKAISQQTQRNVTLGEVFLGLSDHKKADYVRNLKRIPLDGCPEEFARAYREHIVAWDSRDERRITSTFADVLAVARVHGVEFDTRQ
ncbi:hypothetical protein [Limnoglobus roseus]|uniref:Lipoprotein n=1 Tax=Limnoglobus roseus TaxID=2598579 RepID=A0A5C1AIB6_9BACT|nr:hypothetical protein [Limnoglobus roseus]QEL16708.1 hypothetical protein PX52LOC_03671 [Limnoglobus roseus]